METIRSRAGLAENMTHDESAARDIPLCCARKCKHLWNREGQRTAGRMALYHMMVCVIVKLMPRRSDLVSIQISMRDRMVRAQNEGYVISDQDIWWRMWQIQLTY